MPTIYANSLVFAPPKAAENQPILDHKKKLYIFFLFASSLRCFSRTDYPKLTNTFEMLSKHALEEYLPNGSVVYSFGKNPLNKGKYSGLLHTKIINLANELNELPHPRLQKENFAANDTGDGGLDIVGWIPMKDSAPGFTLIFGQCACSPEEWSSKQGTSSINDWQNRITFTVPPSNFVFIPMCFRDTSGEWYNNDRVKLSVVIDRLRLCNLLESRESEFANLASPIVDSLTSKEEAF